MRFISHQSDVAVDGDSELVKLRSQNAANVATRSRRYASFRDGCL
jgi:hypothetical protein